MRIPAFCLAVQSSEYYGQVSNRSPLVRIIFFRLSLIWEVSTNISEEHAFQIFTVPLYREQPVPSEYPSELQNYAVLETHRLRIQISLGNSSPA
jgi:hypothetical protein